VTPLVFPNATPVELSDAADAMAIRANASNDKLRVREPRIQRLISASLGWAVLHDPHRIKMEAEAILREACCRSLAHKIALSRAADWKNTFVSTLIIHVESSRSLRNARDLAMSTFLTTDRRLRFFERWECVAKLMENGRKVAW
jgi:hypothetical protein